MPNKNYEKGARLERKIVNYARDLGLIAFRSAGSHSKVDVTIINLNLRRLVFIQAKAKKLSSGALNKELELLGGGDGSYEVEFKVIDKNNFKDILKSLKEKCPFKHQFNSRIICDNKHKLDNKICSCEGDFKACIYYQTALSNHK